MNEYICLKKKNNNRTTSIELAAIWYIQVSGTPIPDKRLPIQRPEYQQAAHRRRGIYMVWVRSKHVVNTGTRPNQQKNGVGAPLIQVVLFFPVQSPSFNYTTFQICSNFYKQNGGGVGVL